MLKTSKMGFIHSSVFNFVLLCVVGFVISQETTSELPTTTSTAIPTTTVVTTESPSPETTIKPTIPPTTAPITTTSKPPLPEVGSWNISDGNVTCIRAQLQIGFTINIGGVEESFALSPSASDKGSDCQTLNGTQVLALSDKDYALTFVFAKDSSNVFVQHIALVYYASQAEDVYYNSSKLFKMKIGNSYRCKTIDTVHMGNATMEIYYIQIQAFGTAGENDFNTAEECEADDKVSDVIPIAVACALAALIIIVLIAYLVGRRRSRQKGYTSV